MGDEKFLCKDELLREAILDDTLSREALKALARAKVRPPTPETLAWARDVIDRLAHAEYGTSKED